MRRLKTLRTLIGLVWRRKWEVIVGIVGILLALINEFPWIGGILVALSLLILAALIVDFLFGIRRALFSLREKHVPLVVIVGKSEDEYRGMLQDAFRTVAEYGFDEAEYIDLYDLDRDDFVVRASSLPPEPAAWTDVIHQFSQRLSRLEAKLRMAPLMTGQTDRRIYHIFLNCPLALAVGMGGIASNKYEMVLYHRQPGHAPGSYAPVIDFYKDRNGGGRGVDVVRTRPAMRGTIQLENTELLTEELLVSIHLVGRDPKEMVNRQAQRTGCAAVHIRNTYNDQLAVDDNWIQVAQEVWETLQELLARGGVQRLQICPSANVVLGFAIGMALGIQHAVTANQFFTEQNAYLPMVPLDQLRPL